MPNVYRVLSGTVSLNTENMTKIIVQINKSGHRVNEIYLHFFRVLKKVFKLTKMASENKEENPEHINLKVIS